MPDPTPILLTIDDGGYEVSATVTASGTVMEAVNRQTGERFTVTAGDDYVAACALAGLVGVA